MAELAFSVRADYEEVIAMRAELERLREAMLKTDAATEEQRLQLARLEKQYAETSSRLNGMVEKAAESAAQMGDSYALGLSKSSAEYKTMIDALRGAEDGVKSFMREKQRSGELDEETAKKLRVLIYALQGVQGVLKAVSSAQAQATLTSKASSAAAKDSEAAERRKQKAFIETTAAERQAEIAALAMSKAEREEAYHAAVLEVNKKTQARTIAILKGDKEAEAMVTAELAAAEKAAADALIQLIAAETAASSTTSSMASAEKTAAIASAGRAASEKEVVTATTMRTKAEIEATAAGRVAKIETERLAAAEQKEAYHTATLAELKKTQTAALAETTVAQNTAAGTTAKLSATETIATGTTIGLAASETAATGPTLGFAASMRTLNAAMAANPIGVALALLPLATSLISGVNTETDQLTDEVKELNKETQKQLDRLDELFNTLENTSSKTKAHRDAVDEVNEMCKEYNVTLLNENDTIEQQRIKYEQLTVAIRNANAAKIGEKYINSAQDKADAANEKALKKLRRRGAVKVEDLGWEQIALDAQGRAAALAGLSGAAYETKLNEIVDDVTKSIRAEAGVFGWNFRNSKEVEKYKEDIKTYVKTLDTNQKELAATVKRVNDSTTRFTQEIEKTTIELKDATFEQLEAVYGETGEDMDKCTSTIMDAGIAASKEVVASKMTEAALQGTRKELKDRKSRLEKRIDEAVEGSEEQKRLQALVNSIDKELKTRKGDDDPNGGNKKDDTEDKALKERQRSYERYEGQIKSLIDQLETNIAKEQISAIEDNSKAVEMQLDLEKQMLIEKAEEIGKAMSDLFAGNVDLLHRKTIDASKLAEKGWEDAGEGIATVFSSGYGAYDKGGKMHELLVTPILPNGEVLSPEEVQDYIDNVLDGAADFLAADEKGIVIAVDVDEDGGEKLHEMQEVYYELLRLVGEYDALKRQSVEKERQEREADSMNAYLRQYGTYEEKKLAITEDYEKRIAKAQTEGDRLALKRQMDSELVDLENSVNQRYHLIFANAEAMSDTLLAQAIDATGEAIEKAKSSGDIQELTELYARLREQLSVQRDRSRGWGFAGIIEGFGLRDAANQKRQTADALETALELKEAGLAIMTKLGLEPDEIKRTRNEINELRAAINGLREDATQDDEDALLFLRKGFDEVTSVFSQLGSIMSSFRDGERGALDAVADLGDALSGLASHADDLRAAFSEKGMSRGQAISTAISGTIELISMVGKSIANNKKAQEEWNRTIEEADHSYKMLLLDKMDYEQSNIFGAENPFKRAITGAEQYQKAMEGVSELTDKLAKGQVQTGTKKVVDWGNVGKGVGTGAAVGAAIGTIVGPVGSAIGAAVGTAIGAIGGAIAGLASTKVVPVFESLASQYEYLFDEETYELNPRILADYDKLDDDTKQIVSNWEEIRKKAEEARRELKDNLKDFTGDLGKKLEDTLVEAWKSHRLYSAVDDYKKYVGQQIASILEQQAFSSVFEGLFNDLGKRMEDSFLGPDADYSIIDDLDDFNQKFPQYLDAYGQLMDQLNAEMQEMGYEGFRERQTNADASTRSFQQISETTGSAIQGGVTAIRLSSEVRNEHLSLMSASLDEMLRQQMLATTLAENIRAIQVDAYLALVEIRNNTAGNLATVRGIAENVASIEKRTREL